MVDNPQKYKIRGTKREENPQKNNSTHSDRKDGV